MAAHNVAQNRKRIISPLQNATEQNNIQNIEKKINKPGPAQVGAISRAQKYQKDFQVSIYSTQKSKKQKHGPIGAPGPASASPWRAKKGTLPKLSTSLSQLKGTLWRKNNFSKKKSHNAKKLKGGPFGVFQHPFCRKTSKN